MLLLIAAYARYIDPDRFFRFYDPPVRVSHIGQNGWSSPAYQVANDACVLQDWVFRVGSTTVPPIILRTNLYADGTFVLLDGQNREFALGKAVVDPLDPLANMDKVAIDSGTQAILQVSRSCIPYYYGWKILSSAPLFQYFRYYRLTIRQADGLTMQLEWKFSTYRTQEGSWVPDHLGLRGEGLTKLKIRATR